MTLWLKARAARTLTFLAAATVAMVVLPISEMRATPSPAGATLAFAILIALIQPIALGWAMTRGDQRAERISPRAIWLWDLLLVLGFGIVVAAATLGLRLWGLAPAGAIAARAMATFLGIMLLAQPFGGWRTASLAPVALFVAVVIAGRGADIDHPAPWAWIASPESDLLAAVLSTIALMIGAAVAFGRRQTGPVSDDE